MVRVVLFNIYYVETIAFLLGELKNKFDICASHEDLEYGMAEVWKIYVRGLGRTTDISTIRRALHQVKTLEDLQQTENADLAAIYDKMKFLLQQGAEERSKWQTARARDNVDDNDNTDSSYSSAVNVSNMIQRGHPLFIIWFWLKMHPEEASQKDKDGKLPLHYAVHYTGTDRRYKNHYCPVWENLHDHSKMILLNDNNNNENNHNNEDPSTDSFFCVKFVL
jgi:hypothetical protein